jgi:hypothetical protein
MFVCPMRRSVLSQGTSPAALKPAAACAVPLKGSVRAASVPAAAPAFKKLRRLITQTSAEPHDKNARAPAEEF